MASAASTADASMAAVQVGVLAVPTTTIACSRARIIMANLATYPLDLAYSGSSFQVHKFVVSLPVDVIRLICEVVLHTALVVLHYNLNNSMGMNMQYTHTIKIQ